MHPRNIPILAFLIWSVVCWRWYVCGIKGACAEEPQQVVPVVQPIGEQRAAVPSPQPVVKVVEVQEEDSTPVAPAAKAPEAAPKLVEKGTAKGWAALTAQWPTAVEEEAIDRLQLIRNGQVMRAHFPHSINPLAQVELLAPFLRSLAAYLSTHPDRLAVTCFTDGVGSEQDNQRRSKETAHLIQSYLIQQGVPSGQVVAEGLGEQRPVASNDHPQGRYCNRRVEFVLHP
jgi:outer membrane protein OmpA-like peptidoglycan-associated protein